MSYMVSIREAIRRQFFWIKHNAEKKMGLRTTRSLKKIKGYVEFKME